MLQCSILVSHSSYCWISSPLRTAYLRAPTSGCSNLKTRLPPNSKQEYRQSFYKARNSIECPLTTLSLALAWMPYSNLASEHPYDLPLVLKPG